MVVATLNAGVPNLSRPRPCSSQHTCDDDVRLLSNKHVHCNSVFLMLHASWWKAAAEAKAAQGEGGAMDARAGADSEGHVKREGGALDGNAGKRRCFSGQF